MIDLQWLPASDRKRITHVAISAQYHGELLPVTFNTSGSPCVRDQTLASYLCSIPYYREELNVGVRWLGLRSQAEIETAARIYHYPNAAVVTLGSGDVCPERVFNWCPASAVRLRQSGIVQGLRISNACQRVSDLGAIYIEGRDPESECQVFDCGISSTGRARGVLWGARSDYYNAGIHVDDGARAIINGCAISDCEVGILINGHYDGIVSDVTIERCEFRGCGIPMLIVGSPDVKNPVIIRTDMTRISFAVKSGEVRFYRA
jgi:hypothetical protein